MLDLQIGDTEQLAAAIRNELLAFQDWHGRPASFVMLHPTWQPYEEAIQGLLHKGLTISYLPQDFIDPRSFQVGDDDAIENGAIMGRGKVTSENIKDHWLHANMLQSYPSTAKKHVKAVVKTLLKAYEERFGVEPTHIRMAEQHNELAEWLYNKFNLVYTSKAVPDSTPGWIFVGIPEAGNNVGAVEVDSSFIEAIEYFPLTDEEGELQVRFKDGALIAYYGVEPKSYAEFAKAESKGSYWHRYIKGSYVWEKIEDAG